MKIEINAQKEVKKLHNFWNHIHWHPTDGIEDDWAKRQLDRIAKDKVAQTVRMYTMFEDIVSMDENGNLQYDFTLNDQRMDYMIKKGFNLFVDYNFIPPCIAVDPEQKSESERYKGKFISSSYPRDYKLWEEICRVYTQHIVDRYGLEMVTTWRIQCFNEPDLTRYWRPDADNYDVNKAITEYLKLYDHFAKGVKSVSKQIRVGGPSFAGKSEWWEPFFEHISKGTNYATGEVGSPFDFFSIHTYGSGMKSLNAGDKYEFGKTLINLQNKHEIATRYGFGDIEIIVDEWGLCSTGFRDMEACPTFEFRNSEFYSAQFAQLVDKYVEADAPVSKMLMCVCGTYGLTKDFMGYRSLFTLNDFPKPVYNAYVLLAKLGSALLECGKAPENTGVFPTIDVDGKITIMAYHTDDDMFNKVDDVNVTLSLKGLNGVYKMTKYLIDETHCNSYTKYKEFGSPINPDQWQREVIGQAGKVVPMEAPCGIVADGEYELPLTLTNDCMYMIELEPIK